MATIENAKEAFAGESQANRKRQVFSVCLGFSGKRLFYILNGCHEGKVLHNIYLKILDGAGTIKNQKERFLFFYKYS